MQSRTAFLCAVSLLTVLTRCSSCGSTSRAEFDLAVAPAGCSTRRRSGGLPQQPPDRQFAMMVCPNSAGIADRGIASMTRLIARWKLYGGSFYA
jgi:hypothetical protein